MHFHRTLTCLFLALMTCGVMAQPTVACVTGDAIVVGSNGASSDPIVTPFANANIRARHQYLFKASELDVLQHINTNPSAMVGLCAGEPINRIEFLVTSSDQRFGLYSCTIKHSNLSSLQQFDSSVDPASQCSFNQTPLAMPATAPGWTGFDFSATPFIWDGVRNVIIQVCNAVTGPTALNASVQATSGLGFPASFARYGNSTTCNNIAGCGGSTPGCGITSNGCDAGGPSTSRPVVRWNGIVGVLVPVAPMPLIPVSNNPVK